jgi:protein-S-isoprenylcysteine O-methyltransferase Ste14
MGQLLGWPLLLFGLWLALSAAREAGDMEVSAPDTLLTEGPYARSRNPMYVAWVFIHSGISSTANAFWVLALLPLAFVYIHFVDVRREEAFLAEAFGEEYRAYRERVPRYL